MCFILKILVAPVVAVLAIIIWFFAFILNLSSAFFGIASGILGFFGVVILFADSVKNGIIMLVLAFLVSPYGLPMIAAWLLGQLQKLRYAIQDRVYG